MLASECQTYRLYFVFEQDLSRLRREMGFLDLISGKRLRTTANLYYSSYHGGL
jgi:hypothetical protein